ncbi:ABC transporter ATP-binding protein [Paeniglutamicibacter cryotolerans]|uniref:ATP-binding cassette subfamily B protein n=1 Tax=Paeniglutamicibacter cryotolerans TaxID=670079 RepID=A0A839QLV5_9MICC|nr:ABC transporter ATP-binding protein [Paeniglutamicibacter cryotolerans]MBB2996760.1 ATP-binding cassette subfamily B protein [Paeniglutamicibacter cryotolerans]
MLWWILRRYMRPYAKLLIAVGLFQAAQSIASLYLPSLVANIIDNGVAKGDVHYIMVTGGVMLIITLVQVACAITAVYFGAKASMSLGRDLRGAIFHRVSEFSEREVSSFGAPSLITRTTNDVQQVQMVVLMTCTLFVAAPILAIGGVVMAMKQDLGLSWLMAVSVPVLLVSIGLIITRMVPLFRRMQKRIDAVNLVLREQLTGIRVIRAFVREDLETARFAKANTELTETALGAGRLFALMFPIVMMVLNVSSVAVIWFGGLRVADGTMEVGALVAYLSYLLQILMAVMMATFMGVMLPRAAVSGDRIGEVLTTESSVVMPEHGVTLLKGKGTIEFDGVSFSYPGAEQPVLRDLDFTVLSGQTTAIIGSTGAGKTTLVNLLPRLFDATAGTVKVDGVDVKELDPDLLWSRIGLIPQKPYLFAGSVASNLRYGKPDATDDELWAALRIAQAADFVSEMAGGLAAEIAQGGSNVSGGQRQRLAIARALVKEPEIYVFDDSFSALDSATDARLRLALKKHRSGSTMIIIAQRVATIRDADLIIVLEGGAIVGHGTHEELSQASATYAEIVASQLTAEEAA